MQADATSKLLIYELALALATLHLDFIPAFLEHIRLDIATEDFQQELSISQSPLAKESWGERVGQ